MPTPPPPRTPEGPRTVPFHCLRLPARTCLTLASALTLTLAAPAAFAGAMAPVAHGTRFEAITRMEGDAISACGVEVRGFDGGGIEHVLRLLLEGRPAHDPLTVFEVEQAVSMSPAPVQDAAVFVGDFSSRDAGFTVAAGGNTRRGLRLEGEIDATTGALLVRSLLLGGGRLEVVTAAAGAASVVSLRGPAPPDVFRRYLQCAGDLYQPGAEDAP